jgi:competence ComEA-like helix-hairpin-helix protein
VGGSVLVGLLWCLVLLSVIVIGVLHTARMDLIVVKNYGDKVQAHYLAVAGLEKAKALLYRDAQERSRGAQHHNGALYNAPDQFRDVPLGRGEFSVLRQGREDEGGGILYGISDEESRLNVNVASTDELMKLDGMTPGVAAAIMDWRDEDSSVSPGGAEIDYYSSLLPPAQPRNGPLLTTRELLMVRGVTSAWLGSDVPPSAEPGAAGDAGSVASRGGMAGLLTVDSAPRNTTASGGDRLNVQSADERALTGIRGITSEIARAIIAYRGQNRFETIADLLDVTAAQNQNQLNAPGGANSSGNQGQAAPANSRQPGNGRQAATGPKVISQELLMEIGDEITAGDTGDSKGLVNVNTASLDVLACLPGMTRDLAQAVISYRKSGGFFPNIAYLLKVDGLTRDIFKQLAPRVTVRSDTFRILSEGRVKSSGTRQRIQEIVRLGADGFTTVSYREDDL